MSFEITRTELVWPGKYDEDGNLNISPRVSLPFQVVERVNETRATREARNSKVATLFDVWEGADEGETFEDGWRNKLIWGDNKLVMESLLEQYQGKIDFIYIDPPFAVGADFEIDIEIGETSVTKESSIIEDVAYRDTWGNGGQTFLTMLVDRLRLMKDLLSENGVMALHCDWRESHRIRALMDEIFGEDKFVNEVIWRYGKMSNASKKFPQNHDSIFIYSKSNEWTFNPIREADSEYKTRFIRYVRNNKILYGDVKTSEDKLILGRVRKVRKALNRELNNEDVLFDFNLEFKNQDDVFYDISIVKGNAAEKANYPTQKPEALISRLIGAFTLEGDLVADFFVGSGTAVVAAEKMKRRWIGTDLGRFAIQTCRKRLLDVESGNPFDILNLGKYERQYWSNIEFGEDLDGDGQINLLEYIAFILKLYGATPITGAQHLHGKFEKAFVHVGSVSSPITIAEVEESIEETVGLGGRELHILGWEWEMGLIDTLTDFARQRGVKLVARQIPKEVMEFEAARKEQVTFYELAYLSTSISMPAKSDGYVCSLDDFMIPNPELIPDEVRNKISKFADYVDYWAVDWDFQNDTFMPSWMDYRTRQDRNLKLATDVHKYDVAGPYKVMIKVVDIFGNDTSKVIDLEVK